MAKIFITMGVFFLLIGLLMVLFKEFPLFRLPGDIYMEKENFKFYFPITSSVLISVGLTLAFNIIARFFK